MPDGFALENLPYGSCRRSGTAPPRLCVALGEHAIELGALTDRLPGIPARLIDAPNLDRLLAADPEIWRELRGSLQALLADGVPAHAAIPLREAIACLPFSVVDYVDFYSCIEHASNLGRIFRPDADPLTPNYRHLPIGYHGRSSTVIISGTPVRRPNGQLPGRQGPVWGPSRCLDIELELGFVTGGPPTELGEPIAIDHAAEHMFGFVLVDDWSARDIQRWEYQPLGPFLGKSFATSISPWVVPLDALQRYRVPARLQDPEPLPYLRAQQPWALDIELAVELQPEGGEPHKICATNSRDIYWTPAQQLAHASSNGCAIRPGELYASGTISGATPGTQGSLIELTWNGRRPLDLGGAARTFLEDGDTVLISGSGAPRDGGPRIGFGQLRGQIWPAA